MPQSQRDPGAEEFSKIIQSKQNHPNNNKNFFLNIIAQKIGQENTAYILIVSASIMYPLGFLYTNENNFSVFQTSLMRGIVTTVFNYAIARYYNLNIQFKSSQTFRLLLIRNFIIVLQGIVYIFIQFYLTQPIILTINSTGPLFIFLIDYKVNSIKITKQQLYGVILGIAGVLLTVNGQIIIRLIYSDYETTSEFKNYATDNPLYKFIGAFVFVFVQFLWGYAQIITKKIKQIDAIEINFHLGLQILISSALMYPTQVKSPVPIQKFVISLFAGGILIVLSQIMFIKSITMTKNTGSLTMLIFTSVILGYIISVVRYNQKINIFCALGSILIIFGLAKIVLKPKNQNQILQNDQKS